MRNREWLTSGQFVPHTCFKKKLADDDGLLVRVCEHARVCTCVCVYVYVTIHRRSRPTMNRLRVEYSFTSLSLSPSLSSSLSPSFSLFLSLHLLDTLPIVNFARFVVLSTIAHRYTSFSIRLKFQFKHTAHQNLRKKRT